MPGFDSEERKLLDERHELAYNFPLKEIAPKWRNRQTRYVQGVVGIGPCGFDSHLRHCIRPHSSRGPGRRPLKAVTRVRIPYAAYRAKW